MARVSNLKSIQSCSQRAESQTSNMGLEVAGVDFDVNDGIYSNAKMATTNGNVFTVGDCAAAALSREEAKTVKGTGP